MIVFVHIYKTGGTTFEAILKQVYGQHHVLRVARKDVKNGWKPPYKIEVVTGHLLFNQVEGQQVTLLRHPVNRLISHYRAVVGDPLNSLHGVVGKRSLADYIRSGDNIDTSNLMVKILGGWDLEVAKENLKNKCIYGFTELFDLSVHYIGRQLGWKRFPGVAKQNVSIAHVNITDEDIQAIKDSNQDDLELYRYAMEVWDGRKSRNG